jgi:hypothetical protein
MFSGEINFPSINCIEGLIETRRSVVYGRNSASATNPSDQPEPRVAIGADCGPASGIRKRASSSSGRDTRGTEMPIQPSNDGNASSPKGRILPSLVPEQQARRSAPRRLIVRFSVAFSIARAEVAVIARVEGQGPQSKLSRNLDASPELTAQFDGDCEPSVGNSSGQAPRPKANRRVQVPTALDASSVPISAKDQRSITRTESLGALATAVDDASPPNRKRTILGRYVFGDELKPGERWKRRLSAGR